MCSSLRLKRIVDIIGSSLGLIMLSPVFACVSLAVFIEVGTPVIFRQIRPGLQGRPFQMLKFRTMRNVVDVDGSLLSDEERLTPLGRFIRSTSLDELPELWNVIRGEMSLVGPRPLLMKYLNRYTSEQARRHELRPGLTGWAQVNGRNNVGWDDRLAMDVWYVDNQSFWLDMRILALTLFAVLNQEGITAEGHSTMPEFTGTEESTSR